MARYIYNGQFFYYDGHELLNTFLAKKKKVNRIDNHQTVNHINNHQTVNRIDNHQMVNRIGQVNRDRAANDNDTTVLAAVQTAQAARAHVDRASLYVAQTCQRLP